jgi:Zn-dependent M28 family amino/carboxypeptidase
MRAGLLLVLAWTVGQAQPSADSIATIVNARADIAVLCSDSLFGRGYTHHGTHHAAAYITSRLASLNPDTLIVQAFTANGVMSAKPKPSHTPQWESISVHNQPTQNIISFWRGERSDSVILICAHYDHLGVITKTGAIFRGANDNAAGVALLLHLAQRLSQYRPRYSMVIVAMSGEEAGLLGSTFYTEHPTPVPLNQIIEVWNLDLVGFGERGLVAVGGALPDRTPTAIGARILAANASLSSFSSVHLRPNRPNSDQWPFHVRGIPAVFLFTEGGPGHYHDTLDVPESLTLSHFVVLGRLIEQCIWGR